MDVKLKPHVEGAVTVTESTAFSLTITPGEIATIDAKHWPSLERTGLFEEVEKQEELHAV